MKERYEYINGKTAKFWIPWVHKNKLIVQHGRKYTEGRMIFKKFSSHDEAVRERSKLILKIIEKIHRKGFVIVLRSDCPKLKKEVL